MYFPSREYIVKKYNYNVLTFNLPLSDIFDDSLHMYMTVYIYMYTYVYVQCTMYMIVCLHVPSVHVAAPS